MMIFMHQTRNYESYSTFGDADVPEWIEIHSPFTIQKIIKQQSKAYSVFDEVFLFKNPLLEKLISSMTLNIQILILMRCVFQEMS